MKAVISSERLALGPVTLSDADSVFTLCQDAELQRFVPLPVPYTRKDAEYFTSTYATDAATSSTFSLWAIRLTTDAAPPTGPRAIIGAIELRCEPLRSATVGFWLGQPYRGLGIMTEALRALVDYAFDPEKLGLERLHWEAVVGNTASAIVAQRNGFVFEGVSRRALAHRDIRVDAWRASLLRSDPREATEGWPV
ncbi:MAG: GNAT family N-acetyltransferase [Microbacteriaceae bacterium]